MRKRSPSPSDKRWGGKRSDAAEGATSPSASPAVPVTGVPTSLLPSWVTACAGAALLVVALLLLHGKALSFPPLRPLAGTAASEPRDAAKRAVRELAGAGSWAEGAGGGRGERGSSGPGANADEADGVTVPLGGSSHWSHGVSPDRWGKLPSQAQAATQQRTARFQHQFPFTQRTLDAVPSLTPLRVVLLAEDLERLSGHNQSGIVWGSSLLGGWRTARQQEEGRSILLPGEGGFEALVGHWVPSQDAVQGDAWTHLQHRRSVLESEAVAAAAATVALGPAEASLLLGDMLAADLAEHSDRSDQNPAPRGPPAEPPGFGCQVGRSSAWRGAVDGRSLLLVMHEASLTGAPLAVAELAAQARACGALAVRVVLLNRRGAEQLMPWLEERGVEVLAGKGTQSFAAANNSDVVLLGSCTCAPWLRSYLKHYPDGASRVVWWIMENRRRYHDTAAPLLHRVAAAVFISTTQAQLFGNWSSVGSTDGEHGASQGGQGATRGLPPCHPVIPLSVNPDLSALAGVSSLTFMKPPPPGIPPCSAPGPAKGPCPGSGAQAGRMSTVQAGWLAAEEARVSMRQRVRAAMGLGEQDTLALCLSSINPGKGQLPLLQALLTAWHQLPAPGSGAMKASLHEARQLMQVLDAPGWQQTGGIRRPGNDAVLLESVPGERPADTQSEQAPDLQPGAVKGMESERGGPASGALPPGRLVLALGSMGCKSNKPEYVRKMMATVALGSAISPSIKARLQQGGLLWLNSTLRVAPLYAAADVYIMNSQGSGETFGRVSVEAMAFQLPVLGTAQGGTMEIVLHNETGLLHPTGAQGVPVLAQHLRLLHSDRALRLRLARGARRRVQRLFLASRMYGLLGAVLKWMRQRQNLQVEGGHRSRYECQGFRLERVRRGQPSFSEVD